jgi:hypothetical protein
MDWRKFDFDTALTSAWSCDKLFFAAGMAEVVRRLIYPLDAGGIRWQEKTLASKRLNMIY